MKEYELLVHCSNEDGEEWEDHIYIEANSEDEAYSKANAEYSDDVEIVEMQIINWGNEIN